MNKVLILTLAILFQNTTFAQKSAAKSEEKPQKKQVPTAEQILDRYVEVTGGRSRYEKLRTQAAIAVMEIQGKDMKSRIEMYQAAGGLSYVVTELPGVKKSELDIQVKDNAIRIAGVKAVDYTEKASLHRRERAAGRFDRAVTIPVRIDADRVKAEYQDGILALYLPRAEQDKPRAIKIA